MKLLVSGGRNYTDRKRVYAEIMAIFTDYSQEWAGCVLIHGACPTGADKLADDWAAENEVPVMKYPPEWHKYGRAAGPFRNRRMLEEGQPDIVLVFPGGKGTANLLKEAQRMKLHRPTLRIIEVAKDASE